MEKTFNIKTVKNIVHLKGELNLKNAKEIWGKLKNISPSIQQINIKEVQALDITLLQQLILLKNKHKDLIIHAEVPENISIVLENCNVTGMFSSLSNKK